MPNTLSRYFGLNFLRAVAAVFIGVFVLVALVDYIELLRHSARHPNASAWLVLRTSLFRVPQLTERIMPFAVLIGAMSSFLSPRIAPPSSDPAHPDPCTSPEARRPR